MRVGIRSLGLALVSCIVLGGLVPGMASSQSGTVLSHQKISDTQGNFTAILNDANELGNAVAALGDLDGAGPSVATVAVGAAFDDDGGIDRGAIYLMFLAGSGSVLSYQKISDLEGNFLAPLANNDEFGSSVAYLGDLDGAGPSVAALAVGAIGDNDGGNGRGCVYVLFLAGTGNVLSYQKISDTQGNFAAPLVNFDEFGGAVAGLGDLDGAGPSAAAMAVGAVGDDDGGDGRGATYVLFLAGSGNVLSYQKISDLQGNFTATLLDLDEFGSSLADLGDLDGAGPSARAMAVGAALDDDGGADRGAAYVLFLDGAGSVLSHQKISSTQGNFTQVLDDEDEFGGAVGNLGDLDGPGGGITALAVGASGDDDGGAGRGAAYVLFLSSAGSVLSSQKISDLAGNFDAPLIDVDGFGTAVCGVGDLDGPGGSLAAMVVGATGDDDGGPDRGAVYVTFLDGIATTGVPDGGPGELESSLGRVQPNPFGSRTTVSYRLSAPGHVRLDFWDVHGRRVRSLVDRHVGQGEHRAAWDGLDAAGRRVAAGAYYVRMSVDGRVVRKGERALLLR